ncbi:plasmid pRiA4b ORF-3 family protein [Pontiella sulfatireligans]|uniref:Plasmid pRiA4b Orf3-like domain-containing protein n=1 Tax=Pontiella sulfatireligans TaxID=2750658 RepID=A0A6C2UNP3_9BACT|nr:plasmid pRiA4b ORF-3 family protein [Pontiella sulfatireligans]VGO21563.1 hypothetical protein SCARR_03637 [Pontiella sulfatireligans]
MIIKLKIECVYGAYLEEECIRIIALDDSESLYDLHYRIQDAVKFDDDHPFTYFTANSPSPRANRICLTSADGWAAKEDYFDKTLLKDIWPLGEKKLYYRFDFGDDWIFEIRKMRSLKADSEIEVPQVLERIGPNPEQYPYYEE